MTRSSEYDMDLRQQITAMVYRQRMDAWLVHRTDIIGHGAALLQILQSSGTEKEAKASELAGRFPSDLRSVLPGQLVKFLEVDPRWPEPGSPVPAGVRCSTYVFSVPLQVAAEQSKDRLVGGVPIWRLPIDRNELLCHLYASIGLWQPKHVGSFAMSDDTAKELEWHAGEPFGKRFGFRLEELADRLLLILAKNPDLYILILSRERSLFAPCLQDAAPMTPHVSSGKPITPLLALEALFELQRAAIMTSALRDWLALSFYDIRDLTAPSSAEANDVGDAQVAALFSTNGVSSVANSLMMQAATLRRYLRRRPNPLLQADLNSLHDAAASRSIGWNQPQWARTPRGVTELRDALLAQAEMLKRIKGKGLGNHDEPLDTFCGISAYQLPLLAIEQIGRSLTGRSYDALTNELGSIMHSVLLGDDLTAYSSGEPEHARRKAKEFSATYLPARGKIGGAGRFDQTRWSDRYCDAPLFRRLSAYMYDAHARQVRSRNPLLRRIGISLLFLGRRFQQLYRDTNVTPEMARITCDLATSITVLTNDPVFKALLNNMTKILPSEALTARKWASRKRVTGANARTS